MNVRFQQSQTIKQEENIKQSVTSTAVAGSKISKLQDTGAYYLNKIKKESEKLKLLEEEIKRNEIELEYKRKQIVSQQQYSDMKQQQQDPNYIQRQIKQIQINLDKNRQKHNETIARNNQLRLEIDALRKEKNIFNQIYKDLQEELKIKTQEQKDMEKKSQKLKQDFDLIKQTLEQTKQKTFKEQKDFEKEFQNVFKILDKQNRDEKLKDIKQEAKNRKNNEDLLFASKYMGDTYITQLQDQNNENKNNISNSNFDRNFGNSSLFRTQNKFNNKKSKIFNSKDINSLENIKIEVQKYEDTFQQLQKETGKQTIQEIVEKFVEQEEQNFSLFTYINNQSDELENLERTKNNLKEELALIKNPIADKNDQKVKKIKQMQQDIVLFTDKYEKMKKIQGNLQKTLNALKIGIPNIFDKIGCNNKEYLEDWGELLNINDINEGNILQFLGIIEKRTNEILQMYNEIYKKNKDGKNQQSDGQNNQNDSNTSLSVDIVSIKNNETNFLVNRDHNQLKDLIENLEQERNATQKNINNDFKQAKLFDKNEFRKFAEQEIEQINNLKKTGKSLQKK